jgi:putative membrane protein insertion efficiency factor
LSAAVSRETDQVGADSVSRETPKPGPLTALVLLPIKAYRLLISPLLGQRCRYYPSCSAYAEQAIREVGPFRGMILAAWRVLRCNPFSKGGVDLVADRSFFRTDHRDQRNPEETA